MTHAPLPYTADGETLRDARGQAIAVFRDYRDAEACALALVEITELRQEVERLEDKVAQLKGKVSELNSELNA